MSLLHAQNDYGRLALQNAFGLVPHVDPADAPAADAPQIDRAGFSALPDELAYFQSSAVPLS